MIIAKEFKNLFMNEGIKNELQWYRNISFRLFEACRRLYNLWKPNL